MKLIHTFLAAIPLVLTSLASANEPNQTNFLTNNEVVAFIPASESVASDAVNTVNPNVGSGAITIPVVSTAQ